MTDYYISKIPFADVSLSYDFTVPDDAIFAGLIEDKEISYSHGNAVVETKRYLVFLIPRHTSEQSTKGVTE